MAIASEPVAAGDNFELFIEGGVAVLRVWKRPDLTMAEGARLAELQVTRLRTLAARADIRGLVLDLTEAPEVVGPITQKAIEEMFSPFRKRRLRGSLVTGSSPTQRMQLGRLATSIGETLATADRSEALRYVLAK